MQKYWLKYTQSDWDEYDTTTKFTGSVHTSEAKESVLDFTGLVIEAAIRSDAERVEQVRKEVTFTEKGSFEFVFSTDTVPEIGLWKIEIFLFEDAELIGITHHEDFNVIE